MNYRVLTVAREYGSGGAAIAALVAEQLGWRLLDNALIEEIAAAAKVQPDLARGFDERVDSWTHRVSRHALWCAAPPSAPADETQIFDSETMAHLSRAVIERAAAIGNCVVVGRAGQCILQARPDVYHVFVYAPAEDRLARIRKRASCDAEARKLIRSMDVQRAGYVRLHFDQDWTDRHLYNLMISSQPGDAVVAATIVDAMRKVQS